MHSLDTLPDMREFGIVDDFCDGYVSGDRWTLVAPNSGTAVIADAAGGIMALTCSDGTVADNDEVYLHSTDEVFKIADNKPIDVEALFQCSQADTDKLNAFVGVMEAVAEDALQNDGEGPKTDFSGAGFYAVDGDTTWRCIYSDGTTQTTVELDANGSLDGEAKTVASTLYQELRIEIRPKTSTKVDIAFLIDGVTVAKMLDKTYASASEMALMAGAKNGSANNESINLDYLLAKQKR